MVVPSSPKARLRSWPRNSCWISAEFCGVTRPPAAPCSSRATVRKAAFGARPHAALATVNSPSPTMNTVRRPLASPSRPAGTSSSPKVSAYPESTHCTSLSPACRPLRSEGSATFTIDTSSSTMNPATRVTDNAFQRRGSCPSAYSCVTPGSCSSPAQPTRAPASA